MPGTIRVRTGLDQGEHPMSADELRTALQAVPGVASAQVDDENGMAPMVRLWLDGSRSGSAVEDDVEDVISGAGYRRRSTTATENGRRGGLGKGLEALFPLAAEETPPAHLQEIGPAADSRTHRFAKISIEESRGGVVVRVEDANGAQASAEVGEGSRPVDEAVVGAVADLLGVAHEVELVAVDHRVVAGSDIVSVLLESHSGARYAGAAIVEGGRPFTVGRATYAALADAG